MNVWTIEGIVENGQIKVPQGVLLPEHARAYIVIPGAPERETARVVSPHLAHPEQIVDFQMDVEERPIKSSYAFPSASLT